MLKTLSDEPLTVEKVRRRNQTQREKRRQQTGLLIKVNCLERRSRGGGEGQERENRDLHRLITGRQAGRLLSCYPRLQVCFDLQSVSIAVVSPFLSSANSVGPLWKPNLTFCGQNTIINL